MDEYEPVITGLENVYGMNFEHMPELQWRLGFPMAVAAMALTGVALFAVFRRPRWL